MRYSKSMHMTFFDATSCAVVGKRGYLHMKEKAEGSERLSDSLQVTQPIAGSWALNIWVGGGSILGVKTGLFRITCPRRKREHMGTGHSTVYSPSTHILSTADSEHGPQMQ